MPSILPPIHSGWNRVWGDTQKPGLYKEAKAAGCFFYQAVLSKSILTLLFFSRRAVSYLPMELSSIKRVSYGEKKNKRN